MNHKFKRLFALLFSFSMVLCLMSAYAWATEDANPVARIGKTEYGTFQAAYQAAQTNDTITLLDDAVVNEDLTLDKSVTYDGDTGEKDQMGNQITCSFIVLDGTLTIQQGAFNSSGIATMGNNAKVMISGGTFSDGVGVHQRNWNEPITGGAVTITGGTFNDAVYAHTGVLTIQGGTFAAPVKAMTKGAVKSAVVNITGGYFNNDVIKEEGNPTISIQGGFFKLQWIPDHAEWLSHIAENYTPVDSLEHQGYVLAVVPNSELKSVTYQGNGGKNTEEDKDTDEQKFHPAHKFELWKNSDAPQFERQDYAFSSWNTKADGTGKAYAAGEVVKLDTDTTLYAQWTKDVPPTDSSSSAKPAAPAAPAIKEVTDKSIVVNAADGLEYSIDGGKSWKSAAAGESTVTFDGLPPETKYSVIARVAKTDKAEASDASVSAEVTTKKTEEEKPEPDTPSPTPENPTYDSLTSAQKKTSDAVVKALGVDTETAAQMVLEAEKLGVTEDTLKLSAKTITARKDDSDPKGTDFGTLTAQASKRTNSALTLSWKQQKNADGYMIFGNKCGKGSKMKLLKSIKTNSTTSWSQNKLTKDTYYKYMVVAFKNVNGEKMPISASVIIHVPTKGGKVTVAKSVQVNKTSVSLKKGKSFTMKASEVKDETKLKIKAHRNLTFESSNKAVATVNAKGKISGKKKGTATIYIYTQNGIYKTVKVTVK